MRQHVLSTVRSRTVRIVAGLLALGAASCAVSAGDDTTLDAAGHLERALEAFAAKDPGTAWVHARQAVRLDPGNAQAITTFEGMWLALDERGYLNAGRGADEVVSDLGPADDRAERGRTLRLAYGFMAVEFTDGRLASTIDLRGLSVDAVRPREELVAVRDERPWRLGHRQVDRIQVNAEYVVEGETVQTWTELFSVQRMVGLAERGVPLTSFTKSMESAFTRQAPNGTWRILRESDDEVVYEFIVPKGAGAPQQHEVARLVRGTHDIHRVAYARKGESMPRRMRDEWLSRLAEAELRSIPADRTATAVPDSGPGR